MNSCNRSTTRTRGLLIHILWITGYLCITGVALFRSDVVPEMLHWLGSKPRHDPAPLNFVLSEVRRVCNTSSFMADRTRVLCCLHFDGTWKAGFIEQEPGNL